MEQVGSQDGSRWLKMAPKMAPRGPKMLPRWAQEAPRCSKMPQDAPRCSSLDQQLRKKIRKKGLQDWEMNVQGLEVECYGF